jgi:hypothetical protein
MTQSRTSRSAVTAAALVAVFLLAHGTAFAFPGFARKYSPNTSVFTFMPCSGCHDPYPKLTPFGRRFKENGFRVDGDTQTWIEAIKSFPVALRAAATRSGIGDDSGSTRGIVKPIAAGSLGSYASFWVEQSFSVTSDSFSRGNINTAWAGVYDLTRASVPGLVNVRGGAFELDLPFPNAKRHNRFAYDPYALNGGDRFWSLAAPQRGVELSGRPWSTGRYVVSFTDTVRRSEQSTFDPDLYLRVASDFDNAHRVGAFFYDGSDEVVTTGGDVSYAHRKFGADFDLRFAHEGITLYGLYLWGRDRAPEASRSNGGWVQFEKQATSWLLLTSRYTHLTKETGNEDNLALGTQVWFYERLRFAFEYRFQRGDLPDAGSFLIDFVL